MTASEKPNKFKFHYIKSPLCRDLHVSGFFGGINPNTGELHFSVFAERPPIPQAITYEIAESGALGPEQDREGRDGMVRIVQDTLYMDLNAALALQRWLSGHIDGFLKAHPEIVVKEEN